MNPAHVPHDATSQSFLLEKDKHKSTCQHQGQKQAQPENVNFASSIPVRVSHSASMGFPKSTSRRKKIMRDNIQGISMSPFFLSGFFPGIYDRYIYVLTQQPSEAIDSVCIDPYIFIYPAREYQPKPISTKPVHN